MYLTYGFWFRKKYNLPPNDPRYLELTREQIAAEYWAHQYADKGIQDEVEDDDFDAAAELARIEAEAEAEAEAELANIPPEEWELVDLEQ